MSGFWIRIINLAAVAAILIGYIEVTQSRHKEEERLVSLAQEEYEQWQEDNAELLAEIERRKEAAKEAARTEGEQEEEETLFLDGTFHGTAQGYGGPIEVEITMESDVITDISVVSAEAEDEAYFSMAASVIPVILENQTSDVDVVSGATFSTQGIKNAVAAALESAVK